MAGSACPKCGKPRHEAVLVGGPLDGQIVTVEGIPNAILTQHVERPPLALYVADPRIPYGRLVPHVWFLIRRDEDDEPSIDDYGRYRYRY